MKYTNIKEGDRFIVVYEGVNVNAIYGPIDEAKLFVLR